MGRASVKCRIKSVLDLSPVRLLIEIYWETGRLIYEKKVLMNRRAINGKPFSFIGFLLKHFSNDGKFHDNPREYPRARPREWLHIISHEWQLVFLGEMPKKNGIYWNISLVSAENEWEFLRAIKTGRHHLRKLRFWPCHILSFFAPTSIMSLTNAHLVRILPYLSTPRRVIFCMVSK